MPTSQPLLSPAMIISSACSRGASIRASFLLRNALCKNAPSLSSSSPLLGAPCSTRLLSTNRSARYVRMEGSKIDRNSDSYPTPGAGHDFRMSIFGLLFSTSDIMDLQRSIWSTTSFLPQRPAQVLPNEGPFKLLSDLSSIASRMALTLQDDSPGLLAKNQLRTTVTSTLTDQHFVATMNLLQAFKTETDPHQKQHLAQLISDVAFWSQWLIRGVLFEGKLHWELFCAEAIRAPLSKIAFATNAALGRHQVEFVYDDYTLKAAVFSETSDLDVDVDYDDAASIMTAVASIDTYVGFNSMKGGSPEHNFRHIHSLMEYQMKRAFAGGEKILAGNTDGWKDVVEAARRANRIFQTMLRNT